MKHTFEQAYRANSQALVNSQNAKNTAEDGGVQYDLGGNYDYSKPFAEQIDDWIQGNIPARDSLVVSETPEVWKMIGMNALPVTINQKHIDYAINGTKDADHFLTEKGLRQLPEAIKHPVAIISSKTQNGTSLVAMLDVRQNGKQVIVPVVIDGYGRNNNLRIDSNAITSVYGKDFSISRVLFNALNNEANKQDFSIYYVDMKKATALLQGAKVLMPKVPVIGADGFIHSIDEAGSPVKKKFVSQTDTQQFKRWFGKSKVVDEGGKPLVMYHGTSAQNGDFTVFDSSKAVKKGGLGFKALGKGNYFTSKMLDGTERYGSRVISVYLSIQNPFVKETGTLTLQEQFEKATRIQIDGYDALQDAMRKAGYDGVVQYDNDGNINIAVAFDSSQIKSAADNIGTFDKNNPDIRYSLGSEIALAGNAEWGISGADVKLAPLPQDVQQQAQGATQGTENGSPRQPGEADTPLVNAGGKAAFGGNADVATSQTGTEGTASEENGNAAADFDFGLPRKIRELESRGADRAALCDSRLSNCQRSLYLTAWTSSGGVRGICLHFRLWRK